MLSTHDPHDQPHQATAPVRQEPLAQSPTPVPSAFGPTSDATFVVIGLEIKGRTLVTSIVTGDPLMPDAQLLLAATAAALRGEPRHPEGVPL